MSTMIRSETRLLAIIGSGFVRLSTTVQCLCGDSYLIRSRFGYLLSRFAAGCQHQASQAAMRRVGVEARVPHL